MLTLNKISCFYGFLNRYVLAIIFLFIGLNNVSAQAPPNDDCANAADIVPAGIGWGTGIFHSAKTNLKYATRQNGESFSPLQVYGGTDKKSAWYKFSIDLHRNITVHLMQRDSQISQNAVSFAVYKATNCVPDLGEISKQLPVLSKFGFGRNTCLDPGIYFVQVCAKDEAKDSIWIDLDIEPVFGVNYDNAANADDLGVVSGTSNASINVACLTSENASEICPAFGPNAPEYNQTAWVVFKTPSKSGVFGYNINVSGTNTKDTFRFGYNFYEGNAKTGSPLTLLSGCNVYKSVSGRILIPAQNFMCNVKPDTYYTIQTFSQKNDKYNIAIIINNKYADTSKAANPKNIKKANRLGTLAFNKGYHVSDTLACNSAMALYPCGSAMPPFLVDTFYNKTYSRKDTFALSSWFTFTLTKPSKIGISSNSNFAWSRVYKGDITKDCNLTDYFPLNTSVCWQPGNYSVQILGKKTDIGNYYNISFSFASFIAQPAAHYFQPLIAKDLGDITTPLKKGNYKTGTEYFDTIPFRDSIDGVIYNGNGIYRQFYISRPMLLTIRDYYFTDPNLGFQLFLFSGKATDGVGALKNIKVDLSGYGTYPFSSNGSTHNIFQSGCLALPPGWYTIRSGFSSSYCNFTSVEADYITIDTLVKCKPAYNRPYKAFTINNLNAINPAANPGQGYNLPDPCLTCSIDTPFGNFVKTCEPAHGNKIPYNRVSYYVFNLAQESYFHIENSNNMNNYMLCKGDIRKDSTIASNPSALMTPCGDYRSFCRLQPGIYSVVLFEFSSSHTGTQLFFGRISNSKFDNASKAYDFGMLPLNGSQIKSPDDEFTCTTGAYQSDPNINKGAAITVPVPVPENYQISYPSPYRNLWYTFTAKGVGVMKIFLYMHNLNYTSYLFPIVYQSNKNANIPFSVLQANNEVDSTIAQGLAIIPFTNYNTQNDYREADFTKVDCDTHRYYILISNYPGSSLEPYLNLPINLGIEYSGLNYSLNGDHCNNAVPLTLNAPGTVSGASTVYCHSAGESYGEDGSNMACLTDGTPYKTTWFKISYTSNQKADMIFSLTNGTNASNDKVRYRVLYGSCDAMTPGPCVQDAGSSFRLDCMGKGDYFIQVAEPLSATGTVGVSLKASPGSNSDCNPEKPFKPLANFVAEGGCNGGEIKFINYSTQGSAIKYFWNFGNGKTSTEKQPVITYAPKHALDTFYVTLKVTDILHNIADSVRIPVYVFKDAVILKVSNDTVVKCGEKIALHASVNYPYNTFLWDHGTLLDDAYSADPVAILSADTRFIVTAKTQNCTLVDSVRIKVKKDLAVSGSTIICPGQSTVLTSDSGYSSYYWTFNNTSISGQALVVDSPGTYTAVAFTPGGCMMSDTVKVIFASDYQHSIGRDTTVCKGRNLNLHANINGRYHWSTGDTTKDITVKNTSLYRLDTRIGECSIHDSLKITFIDLDSNFLGKPDTTICRGYAAWLNGNVDNAKYLWSTGETTKRIKITGPGIYKLTVTLPGCRGTASKNVFIQAPPQTGIGAKDTSFCEGESGTINVNPVAGAKYRWSTGDTLTMIKIFKTGDYSVDVHKDICDTVLTKHVEVVPLPIPNLGHDTISCFNFEKTLDAGPGYEYLWSPGGRTSRYLDIYLGGTYAVTVKNILGCPGYDTINIITHCEDATIFVPNIFSPAYDGRNDSFNTKGTHITQYKMRIFNRWGQQVFETDDMNKGWDGTFRNQPAPMDVYLWIIDYSAYAKAQTMKGTVHLVR